MVRATFADRKPVTLTRHLAVVKAICASELTCFERCMLFVIETHADNTTGLCHPGIELLARETGLGVTTARRVVRSLVTKGWLSVTASDGRSHTYRATPPVAVAHVAAEPVPDVDDCPDVPFGR